MYNKKSLVGKTLKQIFIDDAKELLKLEFDDGSVSYLMAIGDCCSDCWIEHIHMPYSYSEPISAIEEKDIGEAIPTRQEEDMIYSLNIKFGDSRDMLQIEFRNSSNGYYGGSMELVDERYVDSDNKYTLVPPEGF